MTWLVFCEFKADLFYGYFTSEYWLLNVNIVPNEVFFKRTILSTSPFEINFIIYMLTPAVCETTVTGKPQDCMINLT